MTKLTIIFVGILLTLLIGVTSYIIYDKGNEWLQNQRIQYYNAGYTVGAADWNNQVIASYQQTREIPMIFNNNGTIDEKSIKCLGG